MSKKSKATKAVLASLVATSAIVPAIAVNAEVGGEVTRTGEVTTTSAAATKTIDFKIEDATGMLAKYVPSPGTLVERNGQKYIQLNLAENVLNMIDEVLVGGKTAVYNYGSKMVLIPVSDDFKPVEATFTLTTPVGKMDAKATLTPDAASVKEVTTETKPTEEKPATEEKVYTEGKTFDSVADGTYDIKWDAYKEKVGNYKAISNHFNPDAKLIVKDGKYYVQLTLVEGSKSMVPDITISGKNVVAEDGVFTVEIPSISGLHEASVHVVVAAANMDKPYPFNFAIETADLNLPSADAKPKTPSKVSVTALKDQSQEPSIMHNKYLDDEAKVTATEGGYDVDLTFPEGQHLLGFTVEGATVALKSEEKVGNNTVKIYTVSVDDLSKVYTATADLKVIVGGQVLYETAHDFQMRFGEITSPFTDIANDIHKEYIENLFNKGIFVEAEKFNPKDPLKRYQFALMLNRALDLDVPATTNFQDIAKLDQETQDAIKALNAYGIINGTSATTFGAGDGIKRQHAALMIYRVLEKNGYKATGVTSNFTDLPKAAEAAKAINELNNLGIMTGYNGQVTPNAVLTRSQMAKIVNNTLDVLLDLK